MSNRFDHRSKDTFKKDIKFGTLLEKYFFNKWLDVAWNQGFDIHSHSSNGIDNDGEYIEEGVNTAGADYKVSMSYQNQHCDNLPVEVKWVPTSGKLTLKRNDLKAYSKEGAAVLFILNMGSSKLKKPADYDLQNHIKKIESSEKDIRWGIMMPEKIDKILSLHERFEPIWYMGNKIGIIIKEQEYNKFFNLRNWCI